MSSRMEQLEEVYKSHPYFMDHEFRKGYLVWVQQRHHIEDLKELEKAIKTVVKYPEKFNNPVRMFEFDWPFQNGKCALYPPKKSKEEQEEARKKKWDGYVPGWDSAYQWYRYLPPENAMKLKNHVIGRLRSLKLEEQCDNPFARNSIGRHVLVFWHKYYTDQDFRWRYEAHWRNEEAWRAKARQMEAIGS